ncbi:zinc finger protein OZF isoform X1 [Amyelois transitella]|uniref:zinc finger protein OZF isoform X1 n=1 Tax=Amyelois transitella TaxID=680683 RepID=UPI0029902BB3|nr:zinc finger protein OZF isoform X1 [Amyelois transitella]
MEVCYTCLSTDRMLFPLSKFEEFIRETSMMPCYTFTKGSVCWECCRIIEKFTKFKKQILKAQNLLHTVDKLDLTCLSSLVVHTKSDFDAEYYYTPDPLVISEDYTKSKLEVKKEDVSVNIDDNIDSDDIDYKFDVKIEDDKPILEDINTETVKKRGNKLNKKKKNKSSKDIKDLVDKFTTVVYNEEEMLKRRQEKRERPNFKKIPFKCDMCVLGFTKKDTRDQHIRKKHDENIGPYECDVCHIRSPTESSMTRHRRRHYISYSCKFCRYVTSQMWCMLNHCRVKHGADTSGRLHCTQCGAVRGSSEELDKHIRAEHTLKCDECGEKFKGKNTLRTHKIRVHNVQREFTCDHCSKTFNSRSRLECHVARHSAALASRLSYCVTCRVQYKNIYVYRNHLRNSANHGDELYPCTDCNKKFVSKTYWRKHYNFYHLKKSKFVCEICNKLFISDWRLKNHKQKHHGMSRSRDHDCHVCEKKFYTLSTLRAHELTHSEHRAYMCEDCGDTFKQRPALYTHARLVHQMKKTK